MITFPYHATSFQRPLPASSNFCAGEWMAIARQSSGEEAIAEDEARRGREGALGEVAELRGCEVSGGAGGQTCPR